MFVISASCGKQVREELELAMRDIRRFLERRANPTEPAQPLPIPPGTPIGSGG